MRHILPFQKLYRGLLIACLLIGLELPLSSQGIHFSDFTMAPVAVNPALIGGFRGTYRAQGIFRDQWRSVANSDALQTLVGSIEFNIKGNLLLENDWVSAGLGFVNDGGGSAAWRQSLTSLNVAYHLGLDDDYSRVVSFGVSFGSLQTKLQGQYILWTDLMEGGTSTGQCSLPGCDNGQQQGQPGSSDISAGFTFKQTLDNGAVMRLGVSYLNINGPEQTIAQGRTNQDSIGMPIPGQDRRGDQLRRNFVIFGQGSTLLNPRLRLNPAFLFMQAAGTTQIQLQSTADYLVKAEDQISVTGGLGYRVLPNLDAAYLIGGVKIRDLSVRLTYDITTSSFRQAGGNSFELSVGYIGRIFKDPKVDKVIFCPQL